MNNSKLKPPQLRVNSTYERHFKEHVYGYGREKRAPCFVVNFWGNWATTILTTVDKVPGTSGWMCKTHHKIDTSCIIQTMLKAFGIYCKCTVFKLKGRYSIGNNDCFYEYANSFFESRYTLQDEPVRELQFNGNWSIGSHDKNVNNTFTMFTEHNFLERCIFVCFFLWNGGTWDQIIWWLGHFPTFDVW